MKKVLLSLVAAATYFLSVDTAYSQERSDKPNIVFILADDLGVMDVGAYNGLCFYDTPNLDALAARGALFTDAYAASPVCSPSRFGILTGKHPSRENATNWFSGTRSGRYNPAELHDRMDDDEWTVAEALAAEGYDTAFVGKWHLGDDETLWPEYQGFGLNIGGYSRGRPASYFSPYDNPRLPDAPRGEHLPERLTDEAIRLLNRDSDAPLFLFLSYYSVHDPFQAPRELVQKYRERAKDLEGDAFAWEDQHLPLPWRRRVRTRQGHPTYAAMVESMDTHIGRLVDAIDEAGIGDDTVIVFTSDNGGLSTSEGRPTSNAPYRGGKGWVYEGGIREPLVVVWPGVTRPGQVIDEPVIGTDFFATFLDAAKSAADPPVPEDGRSLLPLLRGESLGERSLYWHYPHYSNQGGFPGGAIRRGEYKLVEHYDDGSVALYNLADDPGEHRDLAAISPGIVRDLRADLHAWYREVDARFLRPKRGRTPWSPYEEN